MLSPLAFLISSRDFFLGSNRVLFPSYTYPWDGSFLLLSGFSFVAALTALWFVLAAGSLVSAFISTILSSYFSSRLSVFKLSSYDFR